LTVDGLVPALIRAARHFSTIHGLISPSFLSRNSAKLAFSRATLASAVRIFAVAHGW